MAVLDPRDDSIVIRVVYDGAPMAGKTTTVCALGRCFGNGVQSPEEVAGRTLYFDWLEYTGGWFEGHQIRCQIVSVPGQTELAPRRRRLLESADVVVFVCSNAATGVATDIAYLRELQAVLRGRAGLPVGIVMQANKRDLPDAIPLPELHEQLEQLGLRAAVAESVAAHGTGVREAFVLAVRLALDRVRELMHAGGLPTLSPSVDSAADLLRELRRDESGQSGCSNESRSIAPPATVPSIGAAALREAVEDADRGSVSAPPTAAVHGPTRPDARVASGLLWPPVEGRLVLHEITMTPPCLEQLPQGGWDGVAGRWRCHTSASPGFTTLEQGRSALLDWARAHAVCQEVLSKDRCIALVADADGSFRLWQVLKVQRTLLQYFSDALHQPAERLATVLLTVLRNFAGMATMLAGIPHRLAPSMDCIGLANGRLCYAGLMPEPSALQPARSWTASEAAQRLAEELQAHRATLHERRAELLAAMAQQRGASAINRGELALLQQILSQGDGTVAEALEARVRMHNL